ncbi:hypothetical protein BN1723_019608, partial [Verticillium longisporum]
SEPCCAHAAPPAHSRRARACQGRVPGAV